LNNELTQLMFDIDAALDKQAGGRNRSKLIRRLRQALEEAG
jgi:hypothetical protein